MVNLNVWGQELDNLRVLYELPNVEVLSLSVNNISTLRDFKHCARLRELYLRKNRIADLAECAPLPLQPHLTPCYLLLCIPSIIHPPAGLGVAKREVVRCPIC